MTASEIILRARHAATTSLCVLPGLFYAPIAAKRRRQLAEIRAFRSILVWNETNGVGNMVLLSGLLLNLRRLYPTARIAVAMPAHRLATAIIDKGLADEVLFFPPDTRNHYAILRFARTVLRPRRFELGLATFFSKTILASCALLLAGCRYRVAYAESSLRGFLNSITLVDGGGHELDRHLRLIEFSKQRLERRIALAVPDTAADRARGFLRERGVGTRRSLIGFHPGCDHINHQKRWPLERFIRLIRRLDERATGDAVVFLGPDERDLEPALRRELGDRVCVVSDDDFIQVVAAIAECDAFVSNDSGLMHVAAALGVPVVAIFGPTETTKNAPIGERVIMAAEDVECRPCFTEDPVTCRFPRRYCLEAIEVDAVADAVDSFLTDATAPRLTRVV